MKNAQLCPICLAEHMTEEALVMVARVFQVERRIKMTRGTLEIRSDKSLILLTFDI